MKYEFVARVRVWLCRGKEKENTERDTTEVGTFGSWKENERAKQARGVTHQSVLVGTRWHPKGANVWIKGLS